MGHNFIQVGEEYDGGDVYAGVNSSPGVLDQVKWTHWIEKGQPLRQERLALRLQDYAWYDLAKGPYKLDFWSDGTFHDWLLLASASGMETSDAMLVFLDGQPLKWSSIGHLDRAFYEVSLLIWVSTVPDAENRLVARTYFKQRDACFRVSTRKPTQIRTNSPALLIDTSRVWISIGV